MKHKHAFLRIWGTVIFLISLFFTILPNPALASTYASDVGKVIADFSNTKNYPRNTSNTYYPWECTWYCAGRAKEKLGTVLKSYGHAKSWYTRAKAAGKQVDKTIASDSIACFDNCSSYGHVVYVEYYDSASGYVYYTEANVEAPLSDQKQSSKDGMLKKATKSAFEKKYSGITGYIHLGKNALTVKYHANGGTIDSVVTGYKYSVSNSAGLNMRSGAGTSYDVLLTLKKGTTFTTSVGNTKTANGYTWAKITYGSQTGWVVISDFVTEAGTVRNTDYYLNGSLVYKTSSSALLSHRMEYGVTAPNGLYNANTFHLTKEGYSFKGWSTATSGAEVIDQDRVLKPEEICPDLKNGSKTITLYAIWEEVSPTVHHFSFDGNGGTGSMEDINVTQGASFTIPTSGFSSPNHGLAGWNVKRNSDNTWYVEGMGWLTESEISANNLTKKLYQSNKAYSLNDSWITATTGAQSYTFYAFWRNSAIKALHISYIGRQALYYVGDTLDTSEVCLLAENTDGTYDKITEGFTCSPSVLTTEGTQTITVSYDSIATTYTVQVTAQKSRPKNATAKTNSIGYMLPSTSAVTIAGQGAYAADTLQVLCKDGDFYLCFFPWGATDVTTANGVLAYVPASTVTLSASVPDATQYYSMNPTGANNATALETVYLYHRPDGGATDVKYGSTSYKKMGPLEAGKEIRVLFEMNGYYCIQTAKHTGFVEKSAIRLHAALTGITVDDCLSLQVNAGKEISTSDLYIWEEYSDGSSIRTTAFDILLPDTSTAGTKYALLSSGNYKTAVPVTITESTIASIEISKQPNKQLYLLGETFDPTGMELCITYENGSSRIITDGFACYAPLSETGYQSVEVQYNNFTVWLTVLVYEKPTGEILSVSGYYEQTVFVPIAYYFNNQEDACAVAIETTISYNGSKLEYCGISFGDDLIGENLAVDDTQANSLTIRYTGNETLPANYIPFEVHFAIIGIAEDNLRSETYPIEINRFVLFDSADRSYQVETFSGEIENLGLIQIAYDAGEGVEVPTTITASYRQTLIIADAPPEKDGYIFLGWSPDDITLYQPGDTITCKYSMTLYAKWLSVPTITPKYPSLNFEDEVYISVYFQLSDVTDVVDMGLIVSDDATVDENDTVIKEYTYKYSSGLYGVRTHGIPAKALGKTIYFKVYAKLSDGSYVYSGVYNYSALDYAKDRLTNSSNANLKKLCVAMLNYGAAAQTYMNYNVDALANATLTADQLTLVDGYTSSMIAEVMAVEEHKIGSFGLRGFEKRYPSISFEGAFGISYYFTPSHVPEKGMKLYYWNTVAYESADVLTMDNATGVVDMVQNGSAYKGMVEGIAAKSVDETIFVAGVYESDGVTYATGILPYSLGAYCVDRATNGSEAMKPLAMATAVYGYCARQYFAN